MISKTSLFDKGIYKATVRRNAWGSILYFILLFLFSGMAILLYESPVEINIDYSGAEVPLILRDSYTVAPMLMSIAVSLVTGILLFRYIHSKKASVFIHGLPVKRSANYISTVLAAFTLMAVPVILNTGILVALSVTSYAQRFGVGDCMTWMWLNLFSLFVMFACSAFIASITGNSFGLVGLSVLFHASGAILIGITSVICNVFVHGFVQEETFLEKLFNFVAIYKIPEIMTGWGNAAAYKGESYTGYVIAFLIFAAVLYIIAGILFTKRRVETAEDVAGFRCLNHIFKYVVTFFAAAGSFSLLVFASSDNQPVLWLMVAIISALAYFGSEMILKKTFRVIKKSYKGYLAFAAVFAVIMCYFAFSGFAGYETYIPDKSDIKKITIGRYYEEMFDFSDESTFEDILKIHREFVAKPEIMHTERGYYWGQEILFTYELKNGKTVVRQYSPDSDMYNSVYETIYNLPGCKEENEGIFAPMKKLNRTVIRANGNILLESMDEAQIKGLVECIKQDVKSLSYSQIYNDGWQVEVEVNYTKSEKDNNDGYVNYSVNVNYINTINWLKQNGLWSSIVAPDSGIIYIQHLSSGYGLNPNESNIKIENAEDRRKIIEFAYSRPRSYIPVDERFEVIHQTDPEFPGYNMMCAITLDEIKELLPGYDLSVLK